MRKITSKHKHEKKRKRNNLILAVVLIGLLFLSTAGYAFQGFGGDPNAQTSQSYEYNGFKFTEKSGFWILDYYGENLIFRHNPEEANINPDINLDSLEKYSGKKLYVYSQDIIAESEIKTNLAAFSDAVENACPENSNCVGFPKKTCEDNFIVVKISEENKISQENNCVFIEGKDGDLTKLADEAIYKILNVI